MSKYNFIKTNQELDDNEILQTKDFNSLLRNYRGYQLKLLYIKVFVFISILALAIFLFINRFQHQTTEEKVTILREDTTAVEKNIPDKPDVEQKTSPNDSANHESYMQKKEKDSESNFAVEYRQAEPVNGYEALYDFFNNNLQLPDTVKFANEIEVLVNCTIDKDGSAKNIDVLQASNQVIIQETRRLVKVMPTWEPAIIEGDTVASSVSFSLKYIIK